MSDPTVATGRQLILYATPTGPLATAIARYDRVVTSELEPTTAQTYPPHCSLTGFFRRAGPSVAVIIEGMGRVIAAAGPVPDGSVEIIGLLATERWVGIELRSPWLIELTVAVAAEDRSRPPDDTIRFKDQLHLSLAYGVDDLERHARLATDLIDPRLEVGWDVALWERRRTGEWARHPSAAAEGGTRADPPPAIRVSSSRRTNDRLHRHRDEDVRPGRPPPAPLDR